MANYLSELIRLFAEEPFNGDKYAALCDEYKDDEQFKAENDVVETAQVRLKKLLDQAGLTRSQQIGKALVELRKKRGHDRRGIYLDLIVARYRKHWTANQQAYFDKYSKLVWLKNDFFLSFTMRTSPRDAPNPMNARYKYFIQQVLGADKYDDAGESAMNLFAEAVHAHLVRDEEYHGFLFTDHVGDQQVVEDKLRQELSDSLIFLQLVQNIMFSAPGDGPNWCFFEYDETKKSMPGAAELEERMWYLVALESPDELPKYDKIPEDYEDWYDHVKSKNALYMQRIPAESDEAARHEKVFERKALLDKKIRCKIDETWDRIFEGAPN